MSKPNRLAEIKALHARREPPWGSIAHDAVTDLLSEIARLRGRVRVDAEDVERAGADWVQANTWLRAHGFSPKPGSDDFGTLWDIDDDGGPFPWIFHRWDARARESIAVQVNRVTRDRRSLGKCGLDILDEMAAVEGAHE
jgi:flavin-dependent dehydrogenase